MRRGNTTGNIGEIDFSDIALAILTTLTTVRLGRFVTEGMARVTHAIVAVVKWRLAVPSPHSAEWENQTHPEQAKSRGLRNQVGVYGNRM